MVKLRFVSLLMPETTAKESKVKLTMWGFTFTLFPDIGWISDLAAFSKSPPGVGNPPTYFCIISKIC